MISWKDQTFQTDIYHSFEIFEIRNENGKYGKVVSVVAMGMDMMSPFENKMKIILFQMNECIRWDSHFRDKIVSISRIKIRFNGNGNGKMAKPVSYSFQLKFILVRHENRF